MKKIMIVCAAVLALTLTSCGDTNYCYEVKQTFTVMGQEQELVTYVWMTKNEINAYEDHIKATSIGQYTDFNVSSRIVVGVNEEDCTDRFINNTH